MFLHLRPWNDAYLQWKVTETNLINAIANIVNFRQYQCQAVYSCSLKMFNNILELLSSRWWEVVKFGSEEYKINKAGFKKCSANCPFLCYLLVCFPILSATYFKVRASHCLSQGDRANLSPSEVFCSKINDKRTDGQMPDIL